MFNRRDLLLKLPLVLVSACIPIKYAEEVIDGIGVTRYPAGQRELAKNICEKLKKRSILTLPNIRDVHGDYLWQFRVE